MSNAILVIVFWTTNGGVATVQVDMRNMEHCKARAAEIWTAEAPRFMFRNAYCVPR